jgi:hypothetical protein
MTTNVPTIGSTITTRDDEGRWVRLAVEWIETEWPYVWVWGYTSTGKRAGVRIVTN